MRRHVLTAVHPYAQCFTDMRILDGATVNRVHNGSRYICHVLPVIFYMTKNDTWFYFFIRSFFVVFVFTKKTIHDQIDPRRALFIIIFPTRTGAEDNKVPRRGCHVTIGYTKIPSNYPKKGSMFEKCWWRVRRIGGWCPLGTPVSSPGPKTYAVG